MPNDWRQKLADELCKTRRKSAKRIAKIVLETMDSVVLTRLACDFNDNLRAGSVVIIDKYCIRHLYGAGHITGFDKNGNEIKMPLSANDLSEIKDVVEDPDLIEIVRGNVRNSNIRYKLERQLVRRHRVVIEVMGRRRLRIVTIYNVKNKPSP